MRSCCISSGSVFGCFVVMNMFLVFGIKLVCSSVMIVDVSLIFRLHRSTNSSVHGIFVVSIR